MPFDEPGLARPPRRKDQLLFLVEALDKLLDTPEHWCRHTMATDDNGFPVPYTSPHATRFCMSGAIERVCFEHNMIQLEPALTMYFNKVPWPVAISAMNDYWETNFDDIKQWIGSVRADLSQQPEA
jgi:hypothetical protein